MQDLSGFDVEHYHLIERLGQGGMAVVYRALNTRLESEVAVKFLRMELIPREYLGTAINRFRQEAQKMAQLSHPNIVRVSDYGVYREMPYLVMPYLPGGTLKKYLGKPISYQEAVRVLLPIAEAVAYTHSKEIIHRDLKPGNILMTETKIPMLIDYGIAKVLDERGSLTVTRADARLGTPQYMAPEQCLGSAVYQSDQYALGIVLYEMLTGKPPYEADTYDAILTKQVFDPLPRLSEKGIKVPRVVENFLYTALAKKPENRFADMDTFKQRLYDLSLEGKARSMVWPGEKVRRDKIKDEMSKKGKESSESTRRIRKGILVGLFLFLILFFAISGLGYINKRSLPTTSTVMNNAQLITRENETPNYINVGNEPSLSPNTPSVEPSVQNLNQEATIQQASISLTQQVGKSGIQTRVASRVTPTLMITNTPTSEPYRYLLLSDGFENGTLKNWDVMQSINSSFVHDQGNTYLNVRSSAGEKTYYGFYQVNNRVDWKDYIVKARVRGKTILCFYVSDSGFYQAGFDIDNNSVYFADVLYSRQQGNVFEAFASSEIDSVKDTWHFVEVAIEGHNLSFFVDDKLVLKATRDTLVSGGIGFILQGGTEFDIDDIQVWQTIE